MTFLERWDVVQGPVDEILVAIRISFPCPILPKFFTPVMHFQWDSNGVLLLARWLH